VVSLFFDHVTFEAATPTSLIVSENGNAQALESDEQSLWCVLEPFMDSWAGLEAVAGIDAFLTVLHDCPDCIRGR
jgi:hypothetical protein